ncbi:MAG: carbon starvation protein A [Planctomycetes bacterium]|nr:carbon starvation protein A [Planctomycetota bacterium]
MSAIIALLAIIWLVVMYKVYGGFIERRLVGPDDNRSTPAVASFDGVDYQSARPVVLFGHHFSSIAGAGPILGPVFACAAFGWGGAILWILIGVVFIGGVHDYLSLMVSVRHGGRSIPDVAREAIGERSRVLFQIFVWLTLVLVVAAFISAATGTFINEPEIVVATFGLIPLAMLFGSLVYRKNWPIAPASLVAIGGFFGLIYLGYLFPIALHDVSALEAEGRFSTAIFVVNLGLGEATARVIWFALLAIYGYVASVLPVWFLLQPRDYIAYWLLIIGMGLGFTGLFLAHPGMDAPAFSAAYSESQGPIWPMLFILIACGAISGFHCLVASGTTAKQLAREGQGRIIGFGGMLTEAALAVLALLAVAGGLSWTGFQDLMAKGGGGPIVAFSKGFGTFTGSILGLVGISGDTAVSLGAFFGMTMINAFVMTTLDTAVRLGRFVTTELVGAPVPLFRNRHVASLGVALAAFLFVATGTGTRLWPMFASANQLVAGLALIVVTAYLIGIRKPAWYTLVPAVFMLVTTIAALIWQAYRSLLPPEGASRNWLIGSLAIVLMVLAVLVAVEAAQIMMARIRARQAGRGTPPTRPPSA